MSRHEVVNPDALLPAVGFAHAVVPADGRFVALGGQTGNLPDGTLPEGLVAQFEQAARNVVTVLEAVGGTPEDLVSMMIYCTDADTYRAELKALGRAYRDVLGSHYPATAFFEVSGLFDPDAVVELVCTAVVGDAGPRGS